MSGDMVFILQVLAQVRGLFVSLKDQSSDFVDFVDTFPI